MAKSLEEIISVMRSRWGLRLLSLLTAYSLCLLVCHFLAWLIRFDFAIDDYYWNELLDTVWFVILVNLLYLALFRQFSGIISFFGVRDLIRLLVALLAASCTIALLHLVDTPPFLEPPPRGVILIFFVLSFLGLAFMRLAFRLYREREAFQGDHRKWNAKRVAIVGAGRVGGSLARDLFARKGLGLKPMFFFDDDQNKWNSRIHDVPVIGKPERMLDEKFRESIDEVIIALPGENRRRVQEVISVAQEIGVKCEKVPSIDELATGRVKVSQLRNIEIQDLLGRDPVALETDNIRKLIQGKTIAVTGAGGSIGSELCRQIAGFNPKRLLLIEQCEVQLFKIEQELVSLGYGSSLAPLIADILDRDRMHSIFQRFKPDGVFHAAAHKHVPMMEHQPGEAFKNNSMGTGIVSEMAEAAGVDFFLMISTDKAINPTSVMGATKRMGEIYIQALNATQPEGTKFLAVRFGNVLGSSGSVVPIFEKQIEAGGPVKVTHPDVTRYFMTIPEAVGLVLQSAVHAHGGEIFVLDMGEPVKIVDLARQLIELHGQKPEVDIEIEFTGLRPGEKLFEEIAHGEENLVATDHSKIMRFICEPENLEDVKQALQDINRKLYILEHDQFKQRLQEAIPEYRPYLT